MALVPQVVDAVKVPVIAAGGIADARGIGAAFALGAAAVRIGWHRPPVITAGSNQPTLSSSIEKTRRITTPQCKMYSRAVRHEQRS